MYAFVLLDDDRSKLLAMFPPNFDRVIAHHVTMCKKNNAPAFENYLDEIYEGEVIGYVTDSRCLETLVVDMFFDTRISHQCDGKRLHCTWSLDPSANWEDTEKLVKPVNSNDLIRLYEVQSVAPVRFRAILKK